MNSLIYHSIAGYTTTQGAQYEKITLSYELFGKKLHTAPIVLVLHALTGNSDVLSDEKGWWKELIGKNKRIDTGQYTVISFNIPGNGYTGDTIENYQDFIAKDIAILVYKVLQKIGVDGLYASIGGSLGGAISWELALYKPGFIEYLIPIACDYKSTDWILAHTFVQENILKQQDGLKIARQMAMLFYRTQESFVRKFNRSKTTDEQQYNVISWLIHHGEKLDSRYEIRAYLMMNRLMSSVGIELNDELFEKKLKSLKSKIIQIAVSSDILYPKEENIKTKKLLDKLGITNEYFEIESDDGHDAFLIEQGQIANYLKKIF